MKKLRQKIPPPKNQTNKFLAPLRKTELKKIYKKYESLNVKECEEQRSKRRSGMREHVCTFIEAGQGSPC